MTVARRDGLISGRHWLAVCAVALGACTEPPPAEPDAAAATAGNEATEGPYFTDVAAEVGVDFVHFAGGTGRYLFPEIMGSGVALFDADGDGDLDLYAIQGALLGPDATMAAATVPFAGDAPPTNRFYRNELVPSGSLRFVDATDTSGLGDTGYGMGAVTGDIDNDGDTDLVLTNFGQNVLYENIGNARFRRLPAALRVEDSEEWTTSASLADVDGDGDLDLFATNYVGFTTNNVIRCESANGALEYCDPNAYPPTLDRLWRNDGELSFSDVSSATGIASASGNGLGTSAADFDGDGDIDIYVANDLMENRLWTQDEAGRFADTALMSGSAYNGSGAAEASMGVTAGDFDGDGDEDLFMTHLAAETNTLYLNDGSGNFFDITDTANLAAASLRLTGFGTGWLDYDNDGWLDLFIANGAVTAVDDEYADRRFPYGQINQLLRNSGGRFRDVTREAGSAFARREVSRGAAFGDIDNDGDIDVAVVNTNGPLRLLRNDVGQDSAWLRIRLRATDGVRDATGTRLVLSLSDGRELWRRAHTDGSYLSASDIRVHFGLGSATARSLRVLWSGGASETYPLDAAVNRELNVVQGTGQAP